MRNEYKRILYIYALITAFLSFVFFTAAGVSTARAETRYVETNERGRIITYTDR